ncbi:DUF4832 domain-containing protein [Asticcacaulis taihuensis]|uniref:DUF4832 domain-containing protein n=1 Tax=Asticcacaulis taihuensis TaxID=260084 RepID=UPI003F7C4803
MTVFAFSRIRRIMALSTLLPMALTACGSGTQASPAPPPDSAVRAVFTATDSDFPNPERGFYHASATGLEALDAAEMARAYAHGYRLIYARINLDDYRDSVLPPAFLNRLEAGFAVARAAGVKLIVRATYNYPQGETEYHDAKDAPLARVKSQLAQLKPLFHRNADVIAFMQAGFIGAWGEWHTSSNNLTTPENRTAIRDALLDAVPPTRFIQFRYPPYIHDWYPNPPGISAALKDNFRIGFHNDCFLASQTDVGTYSEDPATRADEQRFTDALGDAGPFGGETCNPADDPGAIPRTACTDILAEGARYNLTYLNDGYYRRLFHDNWTKGGCMAEVRSHMGYRLALVSATHQKNAARGDTLAISVLVRNSGWARLYNARPVEIILRDPVSGNLRHLEAQGADPRRWLPGTDTTEILKISLPADLPAGNYEVWLALPDADNRIRNDPRFAIRLANADDAAKGQTWDANLGAFALGTRVDIR